MWTDSLYKFVADAPQDLSCGTLYAVRLNQAEGNQKLKYAAFDMEWLDLGHACDSDFEAIIDDISSKSATDFFDITAPQNVDGTVSCPDGYFPSEMHKLFNENVECNKTSFKA